jgi:two-component system, cell cycle sensor histidine kinase and response regulator CckA
MRSRAVAKRGGARVFGSVMGIAALFVVVYWVVESYAHARFIGTPFVDQIFPRDPILIVERLVFVAIMIALTAFYLSAARRAQLKADRIAREDEIKHAAIMENIQEMILLHDLNLTALWANRASADSLGLRPEEIVGRHCYELWHGRSEPCVVCPVLRAIHTGVQQEDDVFTPDGRAFYIKGYPVRDDDGTIAGAIEVTLDVTARKRAEEALVRSQKLESLGVLAGGIAHDFNNILTAIIGNASLARLELSARDASYAAFDDIEKAALRARSLTQQLLTFSKGGAPIKKITPLNDIIRDTAKFALSGSNISSRFELSGDLLAVDADAEQISHVINNIVINAREAMPGGGTIVIRTESVDVAGETMPPLSPRKYVKISIQDQGAGISREDMPRIFDPYYTTKEEQHSGLGLAVAYSVVKKHDGHILVDSEPDVATTFSIYLPAARETEDEVRESAERAPALEGRGRILVMDDEETVRSVLGRILEQFGFEPAFARHGMEAIEKYRDAMESGKAFDAVIMDLTVTGGMGGREAIELLRLVDPDVTAIVSSGYSGDSAMSDYRKYGFDGVIAKPYRMEEMREALARVLSRRRSKR